VEIANEEPRRFDTVIIVEIETKVKRASSGPQPTRHHPKHYKQNYFSNPELPIEMPRCPNSAAKLTTFNFFVAPLKPALFAVSVAFLKESCFAILYAFCAFISLSITTIIYQNIFFVKHILSIFSITDSYHNPGNHLFLYILQQRLVPASLVLYNELL